MYLTFKSLEDLMDKLFGLFILLTKFYLLEFIE